MNSHIVEKTMHSIKNIDRLTDLAAIDVYNTTHDTINKYEIMKEHATEEYTNESFYQESVLAGVLIGAGVLGVAISAFFIIKKIIDTKAASDSSVKSSDGKPVAANVDLRDPKSAEKYKSAVAARIGSLSDSTQIKISKKVNTEAFNAASKQIEDIITSLESIVDNKSDADEISKIINGMKLEAIDLGKVVETVDETATKTNFVEAIGLDNMISLAKLVKDLEDKINGVEKTVNQKGANKKDGENTIEVPADVMNKLKNDTKVNQNIIDALLTSARSFMETTDASVVSAAKIETEAKNKDEEAKPAESPADTGATENKTETATGENKTGEQSAADTGSGAGGNDNTGKQSSTSENVMGPGGQTEAMRQASEAKEAAEAQNKNAMHIPEGSNDKANAQTLNEIINMLKSGKSDEDVMNYLNLNNYSDDQIKDFLAKAKETINSPKNKIIQALTAKGKSPTIAQNIANEICDKYNNDLVQYMNAQIAANPGNDKSAVWAKNEAYKNCMIIATALGMDVNTIPTPDESNPTPESTEEPKTEESKAEEQSKQISPEYQQINDDMMKDLLKTNPFISDSEEHEAENPSEPEKKPEGEDKNPPTAEGSENTTEDTNGIPYNVLSAEYLQSLLNMPEQSAIEAIKKIKDEDIEQMAIGIPKNIFVQLFENAASALATVSPATYLQQLTDMLNNNAAVNKIKALLYQIKQGDRTAFPKLKTTNFKELAELTDGRDVSDYITSILPRVKSAFDSLVNKYKPEMLKGASQIESHILNIEQNVVTFFNFIKDACKGLVNKDKALDKVNDMESLIGQLLGKLDPNFSYGDAYSRNEFGNNTENTPDPFARQRRQGTATAPTPLNPSAPTDWNDRMEALGKAGIPNKKVQVPEPKTAPTPLNPSAPQEWNDNMNALKSAGAENISQKTEVQPISPIDTNADIEKAKAEKAQLDALQQHRQEQLAQLKAERDQREQQVRNAYAQDAQARQNAINEELAKQSQEDEQKKAQAEELTKANDEANVTEAIRQAEEEKKALEEGKNLSVSPQSTEGLDNAAKAVAMQDFIQNFKDPVWREAHPGVVTWQDLYNSDGYKNEAIMKVEAERIKNEKLADNRAGIQFIKEQNYEAIVPSLNKAIETTSDAKTITRYLDGLKTAYAKILMQYQQNPGNARKIIEDYSKDGAAPYEFYAVPYNELNQTQLIDWQQRLFNEKVELDKDRRRNRKKIKAVDKIIDKLIELDELLKTSVHNVIAAATKNPMRALEAALVMFQEGDEEIIAGLTAIENFINKADEVKASEEEADKTPENPAEEPSDEEVSQSILSILKS